MTAFTQMKIGDKIREIREFEKHYTQEFMAQSLGLSTRAYGYIESNQTDIMVNRLTEIANILEVPLTYIINYKEHTGGFYNNFYLNEGNNGPGVNNQVNAFDQIQSLQNQIHFITEQRKEIQKRLK